MSDLGTSQGPDPQGSATPAAASPPASPYNPSQTGGAPASPDATTGTPADAGISPDDLILNPSDGHLYGFKRTIESDTNGKTIYGYQSVDLGLATSDQALGAIAAQTGIPLGTLQVKVTQLQRQNAQTASQGYGKLIGVNPDGTYTYQDANGIRQTTSNPVDLANVGISLGEINQAIAQSGEAQKTITQMGQFTVAGMDQNGNVQVRNYDGTLSTFTPQQAAAGQIPGVSFADYQRAVADFQQNARTQTQAGQFSIQGKNADGTYNLVDYYGRVQTVTAAQLQQGMSQGAVPGVTQSMITQADADAAQSGRTVAETTQLSVTGASYDRYGNLVYTVKDFNGGLHQVLGTNMQAAVQAGQVPGVSMSDLQQAQYQAQNMAWQLSSVNTPANQAGAYAAGGNQLSDTASPSSGAQQSYSNPPPAGGQQTPAGAPSPYSGVSASPAGGGQQTQTPNALSAYSNPPSSVTSGGGQQSGTPNTLAAYGQGSPGGGQQSTAGNPTMLDAYAQALDSYKQQAAANTGSPSTMAATQGAPTAAQQAAYSNPAGNAAADQMTHQQQQEQNQAYQQNVSMTTADNAGQSRNVAGLGFAGVQRPSLAGWG